MNDSEFERKAAERLRASRDELDAATLSRLNQARQKALDELPRARGRASSGRWVPAGAVAVAAVFAVMLWQGRVPEPGIDELGQELALAGEMAEGASLEMELLLNGEGLEMFEDLEFFAALTDEELGATG
jgi:hypothetical protein